MSEQAASDAIVALAIHAQADREARELADRQRTLLRDAVNKVVAAGYVSESEAARIAGVTRRTVRLWLGKKH